jgi:uncharacterized protein YeaO (DUF488 family)
MANLGPSEELRDAILVGRISWSEYSSRYLVILSEVEGSLTISVRKTFGRTDTLKN